MGSRGIRLGVDFPEFDKRRVSADEYFSLRDDGYRYEVFDGVMHVSPSREIWHQAIVGHVVFHLANQIDRLRTGKFMFGSDVNVTPHTPNSPTIYCPDALMVWNADMPRGRDWITRPPAIAIEVVADETRSSDTKCKPRDYARFGVGEYWLIDPGQDAMRVFRNTDSRFETTPTLPDRLASQIVAGLELQLEPIRREYRKWHSVENRV